MNGMQTGDLSSIIAGLTGSLAGSALSDDIVTDILKVLLGH